LKLIRFQKIRFRWFVSGVGVLLVILRLKTVTVFVLPAPSWSLTVGSQKGRHHQRCGKVNAHHKIRGTKMYIYKKTGKQVYAVGHYEPGKKFITETVYQERHEAVERVHYLNGGIDPELFSEVTNHLYALVANINFLVEDLNQRLDRIAKPV